MKNHLKIISVFTLLLILPPVIRQVSAISTSSGSCTYQRQAGFCNASTGPVCAGTSWSTSSWPPNGGTISSNCGGVVITPTGAGTGSVYLPPNFNNGIPSGVSLTPSSSNGTYTGPLYKIGG